MVGRSVGQKKRENEHLKGSGSREGLADKKELAWLKRQHQKVVMTFVIHVLDAEVKTSSSHPTQML